jgi:hypothetical protein
MLKFSIFLIFFPPSKKNILKKNIEHSRKFYLVEMIFQIIYLFVWQTLVQPAKVLQYMILLLDARINPSPPAPQKKNNLGGILEKNLPIQSFFFEKWG